MGTCTYDSLQLRSFIDTSNLHLVPYQPTHHLKNSSTFIDHCIVDDEDKILQYGQMDVSFMSAHDLIYVRYDIEVEKQRVRSITCRDFGRFDGGEFLAEIRELDWGDVFACNNIHLKVHKFNDKLLSCLNRHAPLHRVRCRHAPAPWITAELKVAMKERDRARRVWRRRRDDESHTTFKRLRNGVQERVRRAKSEYYQLAFNNCDNPGRTWTRLRQLGLVRTRSDGRRLPCSVDELNRHFVSTSASLGGSDNREPNESSMDEFDDGRFYWNYITPGCIASALNRSRSDSVGIDGIALSILKMVAPIMMPVIEHICNFSVMHGTFPDLWKTAVICPIPKVKNPHEMGDYRSISILPALSKVLERVVCEQLQTYFEQNGLHDPCQSAYRKDHSTQSSLVGVMDEIRHAADKRQVTLAVFFDLSKAFDRISHGIMLHKLRTFGLSNNAVGWFESYLTGRHQLVRDPIGGGLSEPALVETGVPQGSVLGPLLFAAYIMDLRDVITNCKYSVYADDLMIYLHSNLSDVGNAVSALNGEIDRIVTWTERNQLLLNTEKTKAMIMGTRRFASRISIINQQQIKINGKPVELCDRVKYLGVTLSGNLSWGTHVNEVTKKIRSALYQLKLCRDLLPERLKRELVRSLILPHVDYCCVALTDMTAEQTIQLHRAVNDCIRFIFSIRKDVHITPYYSELRWLKIDLRRLYFVGCFTYNIIHRQRPQYLFNKITLRADVRSRSTRAEVDLLQVPQCRTETFKRSFRIVAATFWNGLPCAVRSATSLGAFRAGLYKHLMGMAETAQV